MGRSHTTSLGSVRETSFTPAGSANTIRNKRKIMTSWGFSRPCLKCGVLTQGSYCPDHRRKTQESKSPRRQLKKQFLYGGDYQKKKKILMGTPGGVCHLCGGGETPSDPWEADHINPEQGHYSALAKAHRSCNRKRGNKPITRTRFTDLPEQN